MSSKFNKVEYLHGDNKMMVAFTDPISKRRTVHTFWVETASSQGVGTIYMDVVRGYSATIIREALNYYAGTVQDAYNVAVTNGEVDMDHLDYVVRREVRAYLRAAKSEAA